MPQPGTFVGKKNAEDFPIACMPSQRNGSTSCGAIDDTRGTKVLTDSCGELYGMTNLVCLHFHTLLRASASHFPSYNDRQRKTKTGKKTAEGSFCRQQASKNSEMQDTTWLVSFFHFCSAVLNSGHFFSLARDLKIWIEQRALDGMLLETPPSSSIAERVRSRLSKSMEYDGFQFAGRRQSHIGIAAMRWMAEIIMVLPKERAIEHCASYRDIRSSTVRR